MPSKETKQLNTLKTRDDHRPIEFTVDGDKFKLQAGMESSWLNTEEFGHKELRSRIEPWLTSLFQSEHLSLLAGSGLTHAVHYMAAEKGAAGMSALTLSNHQTEIDQAAEKAAASAGRKKGNLEDQLRVANELLRGLEILQKDSEAEALREELQTGMQAFAQSILSSEAGIATAEEGKREQALNTLVTFLMSFASRTGVRDRLNIFTTNYDRLIEAGAELAGLHLLDRFLGNLMPIFRSSRLDLDMHYNPPGIRGEPRYLEGVARYTKLHGSVDWVQTGKDIRRIGLPFGAASVEPYLQAPGLGGATAHQLMIYPNAAKDRETADYPYVELFRDLAAAVCRPNSTLVTYGYSFGDEHINRVIRDMLTIPSTHLVVISYDDPLGRIMQTYEEMGRPSQISLLIGPALADLTTLTENYLPKAAIDKTTFRMSELLKQRWGAQQSDGHKEPTAQFAEEQPE
ncbi:SIR2 family protein [Pseudomonas aeruginosa]|uniref:SIR2 family protein n=1 Tax=Pseudomonas aeruginosa TaxID=287 RepID=UPI000F826F3F|nr:SIR2 family protein [Pseudomonas aeruginosa]MDI3611453.1 SIR2 family protein [Pseudomonas aeruginosa]MDI4011872.1 SIR2 family protein [Pseudomonas aeruginosa]MDI4024804.1 SIR2 family protein [Pseudomonas aeruginosa]RTU19432.1 fibronectin-binding protein (FBP) [Pseudomonas aeruginosa]HCF2053697.1 SIR2 family protein [Pseudomonas aeruginosa]